MRKGNKQIKGLMSRVQFQYLRYDDVNAVVHGYDAGTREDFSLSTSSFVDRFLEQFRMLLGEGEYRTVVLQGDYMAYADDAMLASYVGEKGGMIGHKWRKHTASSEDALIVGRSMLYARDGAGAMQVLDTARRNGETASGHSLVLPIGSCHMSIIKYEE